MKTLRAIGIGIIFLALSFTAHTETNNATLANLIDGQFSELKELDLAGEELTKEKVNIDRESIAYGGAKQVWLNNYEEWKKYHNGRKKVFDEFNARCPNAIPESQPCVTERVSLITSDPIKELEESKKKLITRRDELSSQKYKLINLGGRNIVEGFAYLKKRYAIVLRINELQAELKKLQTNYSPRNIPEPKWALW